MVKSVVIVVCGAYRCWSLRRCGVVPWLQVVVVDVLVDGGICG